LDGIRSHCGVDYEYAGVSVLRAFPADSLSPPVFWFLIIFVNIFGTLGYAEEEFWSSCLKLLVVVMFIFIGIIMNCGGGPAGGAYTEYLGGEYFRNPGGFANGFKGVCAVFVTAAFSFGKFFPSRQGPSAQSLTRFSLTSWN
jgi:amino acid transporter